jgi:hypothetical protein
MDIAKNANEDSGERKSVNLLLLPTNNYFTATASLMR